MASTNCKLIFLLAVVISTTTARNLSLRDGTVRDLRKCTEERFRKVELMVARIMSFGPYGRPFPTTPEQLDTYCSNGRDMVHQVETFIRECIKKQIADVTVVIMYSIKSSFYKRFCGPGKKIKEEAKVLMAMAPCVNEHLLPDDRCIMQFVNETKPLVNLADDSLKVPHSCCNYVKSLKCLANQIDTGDVCLSEHRETILDLIRAIFTAINDILCGDFNEYTDRCDKLGPAPSPVMPNLKPYKTFIWVLTDVLASMKTLQPALFRNGKVPLNEFVDYDAN